MNRCGGARPGAIASSILGHRIEAIELIPHQTTSAPFQDPMRDRIGRMIAHPDLYGLPGGNPLILRAILGREPRTMIAYLRELGFGQHRGIAAKLRRYSPSWHGALRFMQSHSTRQFQTF